MRVVVTACHVPFVRGGAERHMQGLVDAFRAAGHETELMRVPFSFFPEAAVENAMAFCENLDLNQTSGPPPDLVVSLQFPGYGIRHDRHVVWLMHQHRAVYELFGKLIPETPSLSQLRERVMAFDTHALSKARRLFANSERVAERLKQFNGLVATPLLHPPPEAEQFYCANSWGYVLFPSRLENLKRQWLLIEAAAHLKSKVKIVLLGEGPQKAALAERIEALGLENRVLLRGFCDRREQLSWYAHALAVFFGPDDEDLGYVTLEAMLASKPVITCTDSGGPLSFVTHEQTGWICPPEPKAIAEVVDQAAQNPAKT
ncbi:MAG TPA: glycosyltransferase, partial [Halothiobacillaceae bacterium]|nr:glycosyltransferase [Halothiobacillaceae bacterium]